MQSTINGRYTLKGVVGSGGMGIVHEALDRLTGRVVAFKQVRLSTDPTYIDPSDTESILKSLRMLHAKEFQILAGLRHPNIISVLDYGFDEAQQPFFTMTYLPDGQTILEAGEPMSFDQKIDLIEQLLQGLAYLHRRGILHRDIKPENVLVANGVLRLLDFGLSHRADEFGTTGGSPLFMAPEVAEGEEPSTSSDLYSVGMLIYQLLVGHHPLKMKQISLGQDLLTFEPDWQPIDSRLRPIMQRLMAKRPAERYQSAGPILLEMAQALERPPVQESEEIRESYLQAATFVGREQELAQLQEPISDLDREKGRLFLLGGESGVGKSRLLDELRSSALVAGWHVVVGQEVATGGAPYQLWQDVILRLCLNVELSDLEAGVLQDVVPSLGRILERDIASPPSLDGLEREHRFVLTLISILQRQPRPTLIVLEDLHWSEESLAPLNQMLNVLDQLANTMVVGSYRHDERPNLPDTLPGSDQIILNRLNDAEIAQLSMAILGDGGSQVQMLDLLTKETEGNTFFIVEVMRAWAEEAGQLDEIGRTELPTQVFTAGIEELLQRRINKVDAADRPLLQLAAVAGRQLDASLLNGLGGMDDADAWLQRVSQSAVIMVRDGRWLFSHDKLRQATMAQLNPDQLKEAHRQVALQIEAIYPEEDQYNGALLTHWKAAGDLEKELDYLIPVADQVIEVVSDYSQGYELLARGLSLVSDADPRRILLLNSQASLCTHDSKFKEGEAIANEVLDLAKAIDDWEGQATSLNTLGVIHRERSQYSQARECFKQALVIGQQQDDIVNMAQSMLQLGVVAEFQKNYETAEDYFKQTLSLYQLMNDQIGISRCYFYLGMLAAQYHNNFEKSLDYSQQSLEIFKAVGNHRSISKSYTSMGIDYASTGRYDTARDLFEKSMVIKESIGDKAGIAHTYLVLGEAYFFEGKAFEKALYFAKKSLDLYFEIDIMAVIGIDYGYIVLSHLALGNTEEALEHALDHFRLQSTMELDKSNGLVHVGVAKILEQLQNSASADPKMQSKINQIAGFTQLESTPQAYIKEAVRVSTIAQIRMVVLIECGLLAMQIGQLEDASAYLTEALEKAHLVNNQHKVDQIEQILQAMLEPV